MNAVGLTELQLAVLTFIINFRKANFGNPPSLRDISAGVGHNGTFGVQRAILALEKAKYLAKVGRSRFLVPAEEMKHK